MKVTLRKEPEASKGCSFVAMYTLHLFGGGDSNALEKKGGEAALKPQSSPNSAHREEKGAVVAPL